MLLQELTAKVLERLEERKLPEQGLPRALLVGREPDRPMGFQYVKEPPYEAVMLGSMSLGELLCFRQEQALEALSLGLPVYLYIPGTPRLTGKNRRLETEVGSALNRLRALGVQLTEGKAHRRLVTAQEARRLRDAGVGLPAGCVLTPSARDVLLGKED